jgi:AtzE family amidohydrolase
MTDPCLRTGFEIAADIRRGVLSAVAVTQAALDRIAARDPGLNCFTTVTAERALAQARAVDAQVLSGQDPGPFAGVPFAVKNLFDIAGVVTVAGSRIHRDHEPAKADATLVARLSAAGGVLLGALNMDEYAYGFTTENAHDGPTHNPHDPARVAGGSSGGSAAAVAAGLAPITLGSDTNGSIRLPAAFCGIFGLKPTYGRLSRGGSVPFVHSFDHVGPFARSVRDLALAYDIMQGPDPRDPAQAPRAVDPTMATLADTGHTPRVAVLDGWFRAMATDGALGAVDEVASALGARERIELPEAARARAAAFCITAAEGGNLHLPDLKSRPEDFDPATRPRFLAGTLLPATLIIQAQRFRAWFHAQVMRVFERFDILIAPATPCNAPLIGQATMELGGVTMPVRPNLGLYTQPLSFIGLPIVSVPVHRSGAMPHGVQVIARPWAETDALRVAAHLESQGVVRAPVV